LPHPVLTRPAGNVAIGGFVEVREERERTDRIVVRAPSFEGSGWSRSPTGPRISRQARG
jgi:competence protein ComEC